ncbi:alpha/beta hydrolase family protein [Undibacterium amnicola]|uniref:alpha/beta hydrolase family protein n=1 Tax=Undibacterium amnicola TaxID=1834038 RepID=UPI001C9A74D0|nr:alpha/beta fold hydrolase [Undibacterium amnicola]
MSLIETTEVIAKDGTCLVGRKYSPVGAVRAVVLMPAAMGVKQQFYAPFAEFLCEHGFAVLSFDYRGMGESLPSQFVDSLRGFDADISDWAELDYNSALLAARAWHADVPLLVIGHSLGGQLAGLLPDNHLIDGMLTVGSGTGYWRYNAPPTKRMVWLLWYFLVPLYTGVCGYFPGKKLRKVGNLPKGVIYQWSRWCKDKRYFVDERGNAMNTYHRQFKAPILSLSFTDDEMMGRRNIDALHDYFSHAPVERRYIQPQDIQAKRVGHFGFFRAEFRHSLWQQALQWLIQQNKHHPSAQTN